MGGTRCEHTCLYGVLYGVLKQQINHSHSALPCQIDSNVYMPFVCTLPENPHTP